MTEKNCNAAIVVQQSASEFFQWCLAKCGRDCDITQCQCQSYPNHRAGQLENGAGPGWTSLQPAMRIPVAESLYMMSLCSLVSLVYVVIPVTRVSMAGRQICVAAEVKTDKHRRRRHGIYHSCQQDDQINVFTTSTCNVTSRLSHLLHCQAYLVLRKAYDETSISNWPHFLPSSFSWTEI